MDLNLQYGSDHDRTYEVHENVHAVFMTDVDGREWMVTADQDGGVKVTLVDSHPVTIEPVAAGTIRVRRRTPI
jgi:hypothetical protein